MTRPKLAIFVGGSRDGYRQAVQAWDRELHMLVAERVCVPTFVHGTNQQLQTREELYVMVHRPVNPHELAPSGMSRGGIHDAEIGIYFFVGSDRVSR